MIPRVVLLYTVLFMSRMAAASQAPADSVSSPQVDTTWSASPSPVIGVPNREPDVVISSESEAESNALHLRFQLLRLRATSVYDSNIDHDLGDVDSYGFMGRLETVVRTHSRPPYIWLGYEGGYQAFSSSTMWDRWEHQVELGTRIPVARALSVVASGDYDNRISTEDRDIVNQFTVSPQLRYDVSRFGARAIGTLRSRRYVETVAYNEDIWMAGGELRVNPLRRTVVRASYRHENATSDTPERSYTRDRILLSQETRLGRRHVFMIRAERQWRNYPLEMVDVGTTEVPREDRRWLAGVSWAWALPWRQDLILDYEFQKRTSNDPEEAYTAHRVELGTRWSLLK